MAVPDNLLRAILEIYPGKLGKCRTCNKGIKGGAEFYAIRAIRIGGEIGPIRAKTCLNEVCRDKQLNYWFGREARWRAYELRMAAKPSADSDSYAGVKPEVFLCRVYYYLMKLAFPANSRFDDPLPPINHYYVDSSQVVKGVLCNEFNWDVAFTTDRKIRAAIIDRKREVVGVPVGSYFITEGRRIAVK